MISTRRLLYVWAAFEVLDWVILPLVIALCAALAWPAHAVEWTPETVAGRAQASGLDVVGAETAARVFRANGDATAAFEEAFEEFLARGQQAIAASLKDSESARWRHVHLLGGDRASVCAWVNARNSYGGYTGWRALMWTPGVGVLDDALAFKLGWPELNAVSQTCR